MSATLLFLCLGANREFQFSSVVQHVRLFLTPWTAAHQASLSITNSWSLLKLMSTESVMPSNHLILCRPLLLLPLIFPSIRVFSNDLALCIRGHSLWLGFGAFTAKAWVQSPVRELRSCKPCDTAQLKKKSPFIEQLCVKWFASS